MKSDVVRLQHMLDAAQKAIAFTEGRNRSVMETDEMLSLAVVRLLEIIGEAAKQIFSRSQSHGTRISLEANCRDQRPIDSWLL